MELIEENIIYIIITAIMLGLLILLISKRKKSNTDERIEKISHESNMEAPNKKNRAYHSTKKGAIFDQVPHPMVKEKKSNWKTASSYDDDMNQLDFLEEDKKETEINSPIQQLSHPQLETTDSKLIYYKKQVLLVDDSLVVRKYVGDLLKNNNYEVITKNDGWEAITYLTNTEIKPDLIISDIEMPIMDGIELIDNIRNEKKYSSIPVIIISAHAENHLRLMEEEKIQGFIRKPFNNEDLLLQVNYVMEE